jgi:hypothetical protein
MPWKSGPAERGTWPDDKCSPFACDARVIRYSRWTCAQLNCNESSMPRAQNKAKDSRREETPNALVRNEGILP